MDVRENTEFLTRLVGLAEVFDVKLSPHRQALYFEGLRDLPLEVVIQALSQAVKTCTWFPKPAELRTLALGASEDRAEQAWMLLKRAMGQLGSYGSLIVDDPALGDAITAVFGSWPAACATELSPEMWASKRKEFGRVYRVLQQRGLIGGRYLVGICETHNHGKSEWMRFVPVARLSGSGEVQALSLKEAETARMELASQSHGFRQITEGQDPPNLHRDSA